LFARLPTGSEPGPVMSRPPPSRRTARRPRFPVGPRPALQAPGGGVPGNRRATGSRCEGGGHRIGGGL